MQITIEQAKLERAKATTLTNSSPKKDCYFPEEKTEVDLPITAATKKAIDSGQEYQDRE